MGSRILFLVVALFLATAPSNFGQDAKKDLDKFQGTWEMADFVIGGRTVNELVGKAKVIVAGNKFSIAGGEGREKSFTFKLNDQTKPASIDITALDGPFQGEANPGIYRFEKDTLQICVPNKTSKDRPKEFTAPEGSIMVLMTLNREKK